MPDPARAVQGRHVHSGALHHRPVGASPRSVPGCVIRDRHSPAVKSSPCAPRLQLELEVREAAVHARGMSRDRTPAVSTAPLRGPRRRRPRRRRRRSARRRDRSRRARYACISCSRSTSTGQMATLPAGARRTRAGARFFTAAWRRFRPLGGTAQGPEGKQRPRDAPRELDVAELVEQLLGLSLLPSVRFLEGLPFDLRARWTSRSRSSGSRRRQCPQEVQATSATAIIQSRSASQRLRRATRLLIPPISPISRSLPPGRDYKRRTGLEPATSSLGSSRSTS